MMRESLSEERANQNPQSFSGQELTAIDQSLFLAASYIQLHLPYCAKLRMSTYFIWQQ